MEKSVKLLGIFALAALISCGGDTEQKEETAGTATAPVVEEVVDAVAPDFRLDKGIGPATLVTFDEAVNAEMAEAGKVLYSQMCTACHKPEIKFIGPAQKGILDRRSPEWIINMIINPQEMLEKNEAAKALLAEYNNVPMTDMGLTEKQARDIVEYFRTL